MKKFKHLVIVESPAKSKTISKFLGKDYEISASYGHVRDLPARTLGVDLKNNFEPTYKTMKDKTKVVKELKKLSKSAETVFIATDPDREGEAIAWHIVNAIDVPDEKIKRIVFNEITKSAIQNAITDSRPLDMDLVDAQQARRILDRLIGYKLSPVLSKKIRKGLSAGRVQSVAVKIICDREKEIKNFIPEEYWVIEATLNKNKDSKTFTSTLFAEKEIDKKITISNEKNAKKVQSLLEKSTYTVETLKSKKVNRNPAPPFITSTLQQESSRKLNWSAKKTMMMAQRLYEQGHITYMRTDSVRISDEARAEAKTYIMNKYSDKYLSPFGGVFKQKKGVQDAHEAIRPSYVTKDPKSISSLSDDEAKLYKLIWERFMASQMSASISNRTQIMIKASNDDTPYFLKTTGSVVIFDGFTVLYSEGKDHEDDEKNEKLPMLEEKEALEKQAIKSDQKFTQPPYRYTEATLVKEMEEKGIGRPSTYAPTISTIVDRGYIEKEKKTLFPSDLGELVNTKLEGFFQQILDTDFTATMETQLDEIMDGKHDWQKVVSDFYGPFADLIDVAYDKMEKVNTDRPSDEVCDKCSEPMIIKAGRFGDFLACSNFPDCKNTKSIIVEIGVDCPECTKPMIQKKSKRGKVFYGCSGFPSCKFATWDQPLAQECPVCQNPYMLTKGASSKNNDPKPYCPACVEKKKAEKSDENDTQGSKKDTKEDNKETKKKTKKVTKK